MLDAAGAEEALSLLGALLDEDGLQESVVIVGGTGLLLLGFIDRPTRDVDVVALAAGDGYHKVATLPRELARRVADVGAALGLPRDWMNVGPSALVDQGAASKHLLDLQALTPSAGELLSAARWARTHDPSDGFRRELLTALTFLGLEVGDADL